MIHSMTAFASRTGSFGPTSWSWDIRSVNARGLDVRLRLPDGFETVEAALRAGIGKICHRGNVSVTLRIQRGADDAALMIDTAQLDRVLQALDTVQERAFAMGVTLGQPTAADVLAQRGVVTAGTADDDTAPLIAALTADIDHLLADLQTMRANEGRALAGVVSAQLDRIADLRLAASEAAAARAPVVRENHRAAMLRILDDIPATDETRIAQELALLAVKTDVTEEIDRLEAHVAAARDLLAQAGPIGRKLDFLAQEFNREANTLCAKAQSTPLTAIGLDLKAVIEQMREQIQNME